MNGKLLLKSVLAVACFSAQQLWSAEPARPNIVLIMSDDQGYGDVGFQQLPASADLATPNLDRLAASGVRLTNGYVTSVMCSPSRAGMLTGRSQSRFGYEVNDVDANIGPPATEIMLPRVLKQAGYATGAIGKWHLGATDELRPEARGFDEFFGFLGGGHDHYEAIERPVGNRGPLVRQGQAVTFKGYITEVLTAGAVDYVKRHRDEPFFLYVAYNAPHSPMQAPPKYLERAVKHQPAFQPALDAIKAANGGVIPQNYACDRNGPRDQMRLTYCAMVAALDDGVGQILQTIEDQKLKEKTLVIFLSDNGGALGANRYLGANNDPLREGKGSVYDGGTRIPFVLSWPGKLPAGTVYEKAIWSGDIFATAAALAGGKIPDDRPIDSVNVFPFLTGQDLGEPHDFLRWRVLDRGQYAVRQGDFKLTKTKDQKEPALFHIGKDPHEIEDVSDAYPAIRQALMAEFERWEKELPTPRKTSQKGRDAE